MAQILKPSEMFPTGQDEYTEKNLLRLHVVHHKSPMERPGIEPESRRWGIGQIGKEKPEPLHGLMPLKTRQQNM